MYLYILLGFIDKVYKKAHNQTDHNTVSPYKGET